MDYATGSTHPNDMEEASVLVVPDFGVMRTSRNNPTVMVVPLGDSTSAIHVALPEQKVVWTLYSLNQIYFLLRGHSGSFDNDARRWLRDELHFHFQRNWPSSELFALRMGEEACPIIRELYAEFKSRVRVSA